MLTHMPARSINRNFPTVSTHAMLVPLATNEIPVIVSLAVVTRRAQMIRAKADRWIRIGDPTKEVDQKLGSDILFGLSVSSISAKSILHLVPHHRHLFVGSRKGRYARNCNQINRRE
jgi:hypothetical protein